MALFAWVRACTRIALESRVGCSLEKRGRAWSVEHRKERSEDRARKEPVLIDGDLVLESVSIHPRFILWPAMKIASKVLRLLLNSLCRA